MTEPTINERYKAFRDNAETFVEHMRILIAALERDGKDEEATNLRVCALMPWEAALVLGLAPGVVAEIINYHGHR